MIWLLLSACSEKGISVYNTPPVVSITAPENDARYDAGELIELRGLVDDGQQAPETLDVIWSSSEDGTLGSAEADSDGLVYLPVTELSPDVIHVITLQATDEDGTSGEDSITVRIGETEEAGGPGGDDTQAPELGSPPTLIWIGPEDGASVQAGDPLSVTATATDPDQGWESLHLILASSLQGVLWEGNPLESGSVSFSVEGLEEGEHLLSLSLEDADGNLVEESRDLEVLGDGIPEVSILAPGDGDSFWTTDSITLEAETLDDLTLPESLILGWSSSLDGSLASPAADSYGYSAVVVEGLSEGEHVLTLTALDENKQEGSDTLLLTIVDPLNSDEDGDGYTENEGDCDDSDGSLYPGASEVCDSLDNDCDGALNEDWWDDYDSDTGADNDSSSTCADLGEVDGSVLWEGDYLELSGLSLHSSTDEDWFYFGVDDDWYDNANFAVNISSLSADAQWVLELYDMNGSSPVLEDSDSGGGSLRVSFGGSIWTEGEACFAVRVCSTTWSGGSVCSTDYSLEIDA